MVLDQLGCTELVGLTPIDGRVLPGVRRSLEVGLDGVDREGGDDVCGDADLGGDLLDLLPGGVEVLDDRAIPRLELGAEVGQERVVELDPLVGGLLGDDQGGTGAGLR